jgi:prolyl-tRNA synthetase
MGVPLAEAATKIDALLREIQNKLFEKAKAFRDANMHQIDSYEEFKKKIEAPGGFFLAHWDGTKETEDKIAEETKATIRCIPFNLGKEEGKCMVTGNPSKQRVVFAKSY